MQKNADNRTSIRIYEMVRIGLRKSWRRCMDSIKYSPIYNEPERSTAFRLGTGNGFTIDLKVKLVTVVLCWVYVIIQRKIMSSIFCPKQAVFSYWDFWTSNFVEALAHGHFLQNKHITKSLPFGRPHCILQLCVYAFCSCLPSMSMNSSPVMVSFSRR